jgi:hypothetical protein
MGTVLCNQSMQNLAQYYANHGTRLPFIRGNKEATESWIKVLYNTADIVYDLQPVELVKNMTEIKGIDRPTAPQVVTAVSNFEGEQPFHGICCSGDGDDSQSLDEGLMDDEPLPLEEFPTHIEATTTPSAAHHESKASNMSDGENSQDVVSSPGTSKTVVEDHAVETPKAVQLLGSQRPLHALQPFVEDCKTEQISPEPKRILQARSQEQPDASKKTKHSFLDVLNR